MVQTPVGARCPACARLYKLPTYRVSAGYHLRAAGTGLGMAIVSGLVWGLINGLVPFFLLNIALGAGVGYAIGEVVGLSVNRKRSRALAATAGLAVVISYLFKVFLFAHLLPFGGLFLNPFRIVLDLVALALGIYVAVNRLR